MNNKKLNLKFWILVGLFVLLILAWFFGVISPLEGIRDFTNNQSIIKSLKPFVIFLVLGGLINWQMHTISRRAGQTTAIILLIVTVIPIIQGIIVQRGVGNNNITFDYAEGSCVTDLQCSHKGEGCGGGHGKCTSDPLGDNGLSTCDINEDFPSNNGYSCGCVEQAGLCGWEK